MTEFKQIIGRGTRVNEDYNKYWFTIMDFKKATELFSDKAFDGDPVVIYEPSPDNPPVPPEDSTEKIDEGNKEDVKGRTKYVVGDVTVYVMAERVQYYGMQGKLITESLKDYTKKTVKKDYSSLNDFLKKWSSGEQKSAILNELQEHGVLLEPLAEEVGKDFDAFDLICHVAFDQPPLTRRERVEKIKKRNYFAKYGNQARKVLEKLLEKYADTGIQHIEDINILTVSPFCDLGTPVQLVSAFGGKSYYLKAVQELKYELYA
jgi:type I restriction enzyme R subunit